MPFALAAACLFAVSVPAMADDSIDLEKNGSIRIDIRAYATDEAVGGGSLDLYRVADIGDANGSFYYTYTEPFSGCSEDLLTGEALDKAETAQTFSEWVSVHSVAAQETVSVSEEGETHFLNLSCGLYMVAQAEAAEGYNAINSFLVSVPFNEDGTWVYDVDATPKTSPVTRAEEPKEEPKDEPGDQNPDDGNNGNTGTTIGGNNGGLTGSNTGGTNSGSTTRGSGRAKTGDYNYFVYGVLVIGAVVAIVILLRRRSSRTEE